MNDIERDLATLFHERADDVDTSTVPPDGVLRRGRRRQIGTILGGAALVVSTALVLIVAIAAVRPAPDSVPAVPSYPSRITTIHGITVTAPAGWTLIDDWPIAASLPASSETCSFTGTASAIPPSGVDGAGSAAPSAEPSGSCSTQPMTLPAGAPVLQLANFSFSLDASLCTAGELRPVEVPANGVAMYVAAFDGPMTTADVLDACAGSQELTTFADRSVRQVYVAVSIVGPDAAAADVATIDRMMNDLGGIRIPDEQAVAGSPGYVVAAGDDGATAWRIEAGFPFRGSASGIGTTLITSDEDAHETVSDPVAPVGSGEAPTEEVLPLAPQPSALLWGTSSPDVTAIVDVAGDGTRTAATLVPWPDGMRITTSRDEQPQLDGWIWFAVVPEPGRIETTGVTSASATPAPPTRAVQLRTRQTDTGDLVIYGNDLGHGWELRHENGRIVVYLDGSSTPSGSVEMLNGRWGVIDVDGGSFVVGSFDDSVRRLWVTEQGSDASIDGGYANAQDRTGAPGRVWLIPLPGSGWGTLENGVATRGWWISWPSVTNLHRGAVLRAGGDGTDVSWSLVWRDDHCVQLQVDTSSVAGASDCLPPWVDLQRKGGTPLVGGVYGQQVAVIALVLPPDATITSFGTDGAGPEPECPAPIRVESNYSNTQFCVFPLAVGSSATTTLDANGDPLGSPIGIAAEPGRIELTQGTGPTGASSAPTPSPSP
jgi:hypothetical protein